MKIYSPISSALWMTVLMVVLLYACQSRNTSANDWPEYLGGADRNHYSSLQQIDTGNVGKLQLAWTYNTPDTGQMQANPIIVDGVLYSVSASLQAFALDAATGQEIWRFGDPLKNNLSTSRGVAYWTDGKNDKRILFTSGSWLYALDATNGKPIENFGEAGRTDLRVALGAQAANKFVISNTPGTIFEQYIIMPLRVGEDANAAPGHIQAFDVKTGKLAWVFHTIPLPGEEGFETWPADIWDQNDIGGVNNWAGMAIDREKAMLFVPTGSASFDFYGGNRIGANLYSNCLLALDARTGKRIWHYQFVHHDLWDRDFPAPPNLLTVMHRGSKIAAVAQVTKTGHVLVFDRETGEPLFPNKEMPAPPSDVPGEATWPTQPVWEAPDAFVRQSIEEDGLNPYSKDLDSLKGVFRTLKRGFYAPPSKQGTLVLPGIDGGAEWGGAAVDPDGILYVNANEMAWVLTLIDAPRKESLQQMTKGEKLYTLNCGSCHGANLKGNAASGYPALDNISQRLDRATIRQTILNGKGMMPGFTQLTAEERDAIAAFLLGDEKKEATDEGTTETAGKRQMPYKITGYNKFLDSEGYPAISPPWGTLSAIDLNTGKMQWQNVLGEYPELTKAGIAPTGTENYGGPVVTAGGLIFIAATRDATLRAFSKSTGKLLWEYPLPAAGFATPSTYQVAGKQYLVIACGGGKLGTRKGHQLLAFALPN